MTYRGESLQATIAMGIGGHSDPLKMFDEVIGEETGFSCVAIIDVPGMPPINRHPASDCFIASIAEKAPDAIPFRRLPTCPSGFAPVQARQVDAGRNSPIKA